MNFTRTSFAFLCSLGAGLFFAGVPTASAAEPAAAATEHTWLEQRGVTPIHGDASAATAKAAICVACHGPSGNAIVPLFPSLAGQRADYLYGELVKFKRGARPTSPMGAQVATLSDADMRNLAVYFAAQTPAGAPTGTGTNPRGEALFTSGDPARGIPPCQGCHGVEGKGIAGERFITWPTLHAQHADYIAARLKAYRDTKPTDSSNDFIMLSVAHTLDDDAINALAAYLGAMTPGH